MHPESKKKNYQLFDFACVAGGESFHPSAAGAFVERQISMNTQNSTAEIASQALATLAVALEAGNSAALTAYLNVAARFHHYSWTNCLLIAIQTTVT
jgi:hypothetical protein